MKIIIVGCGRVGQTLAQQLNEEGNDVVVVDRSAGRVREIANKYDLLGIIGNGATHTTLTEAGIDSADLLIAVTGSDELNLLCCIMAKRYSACRTIARLKSPEYATETQYLKQELGLAMIINPDYAAAKEIARVLNFPSAITIETFAKGRVELLKFRLPEGSALAGMSVKDAVMRFKASVLICTVERGEDAYIPNGDFIFSERDIISIIGPAKAAMEFFDKIDYKIQPVKDAAIIGTSDTAHYLCGELEKSGIRIKIIEPDEKKCEDFAARHDGVTVICGDPTDEDLLKEEGVVSSDALVALSHIDEENIMLSLFAKSAGVKKTVTKINRIEYSKVINSLELDSIINPKNITADMIGRYVRAMKNTAGSNMETLYNVIKGKIEAAEFTVGETSPIINTPLFALPIKKNVLIAAILRGRQLIIPRGADVIMPHDSVVIVTEEQKIYDLSDILDE